MSPLTALFVFVFAAGSWAAIPHGWEACKMSSKDFEPCIVRQVNKAIQTLKRGSKPLSVNPLDPLKILSLKIDQGSGPVSIKVEFKNSDLVGLSTCVLETVKNDWKRIEGTGHCKYVDIVGKYKIDGKILALPITGDGDGRVHLENAFVEASMNLKEVEGKDGVKYMKAENWDMNLSPEKTSYHFENLFNGNKALAENMNAFLNENGDQIFNEIKPGISSALSQAFTQVSNQIFSKIPANEIKIK